MIRFMRQKPHRVWGWRGSPPGFSELERTLRDLVDPVSFVVQQECLVKKENSSFLFLPGTHKGDGSALTLRYYTWLTPGKNRDALSGTAGRAGWVLQVSDGRKSQGRKDCKEYTETAGNTPRLQGMLWCQPGEGESLHELINPSQEASAIPHVCFWTSHLFLESSGKVWRSDRIQSPSECTDCQWTLLSAPSQLPITFSRTDEGKVGTGLLKNKGSLQFEDKWDSMRPIVLKLLRQESVTKQQWFDLFSDVHAVCLWDDKGPAKIHQALKEDILDFIKQAQARVLSHQDDTALLKAYIVEWRKFFTQCDILPKPFCQLEITLMGKQGSNKKSNVEDSIVRKLMLDTWNESIFSNIKNRLQDSAMKLVHAERLGEAFDSQLVIGVRESYVNLCSNPEDKLQIYRDNFEKAYLDSTERFYRTQAPSYLQQNGVQNYMKYADAKLKEEEKRALRYLETRRECNSVQALMECCVNALVTSFKETILAECQGMIKRNETEKLHLMFSLMDKVPNGIEPMLKDLEEHIVSAGLADMVAAAETITTDSEKYVEQLLTLFNRFSKLVKEAFQDDPRFLTARDKAYKAVVNDATIFKLELPLKQKGVGLKTQPESKCPELLANYCDMLLRKTPLSKKLTSEEIEAKLKEVLLVLKYVQNKDVFMRYHKAHLTRRLILDISADSEIEENMVEWLREVGMPADYVNKLARMFQDIKVSEDLNQAFKEMHKNNKLALPADSVNIKILNAGAWSRSSEKVFVSLPTELEDLIPEVEEFYKKNHSGRKLHWHHLMSNGIITFKNEVGQYDLEVTTFQLAVLFAWNQRPKEKITFENLKLATELPDAELRRTLWSLVAFPKLKRQVLSYEPSVNSPKDFTDSTLFSVNQEFSLIKNSKVQKRGKINLIGRLQLTTERMREEENEGIVQLRILRTQEAIIQIMKMRKKITNAQLQTELVEILKNMFLPQKKMIKEQIEWLIEHKYIRRDESDINTFIYMA
ncbi:cullin-5 [Pelobates cultripes]|uniref:Cullin-5 n=1 Tax=Pelobates cultripes TaxID=61616 RepID=A0AAD1R7Y4_PELCU|nr:cullin-5 [Pelobates cultripes]